MAAELPPAFVKEFAPMAEGFMAMPLEVLVRFGRWDEIWREPDTYLEHMPFSRAFHYAARATAFAAKGDPVRARAEQAVFAERAKLVPKEHFVGNNPAEAILAVASRMLEGEILIAEGKTDAGLGELQQALELEDALKYDEPPGWMIPLRHVIGAT